MLCWRHWPIQTSRSLKQRKSSLSVPALASQARFRRRRCSGIVSELARYLYGVKDRLTHVAHGFHGCRATGVAFCLLVESPLNGYQNRPGPRPDAPQWRSRSVVSTTHQIGSFVLFVVSVPTPAPSRTTPPAAGRGGRGCVTWRLRRAAPRDGPPPSGRWR